MLTDVDPCKVVVSLLSHSDTEVKRMALQFGMSLLEGVSPMLAVDTSPCLTEHYSSSGWGLYHW